MKPYYSEAGIEIYHGDCREILPSLPKVDLVLTDPPYGIDIGAMNMGNQTSHIGTEWDKHPVSSDLLRTVVDMGKVAIVWGGNYYDLEPSGAWLVWDKESAGVTGFADAELAWSNRVGALRLKRHLWSGPYMKIVEKRQHPTQKPLALMKWCIGLVSDAQTILDPFMGSGTTLRAAKDLGRKAIGIEIEEKYCEIAAKRLSQEVLQFA